MLMATAIAISCVWVLVREPFSSCSDLHLTVKGLRGKSDLMPVLRDSSGELQPNYT
jgi:hypothetical protein